MTEWPWRMTTQALLPARPEATSPGRYDIYPTFPVGSGKIQIGFAHLASRLVGKPRILLDGYGGVFWEHFQGRLDAELRRMDQAYRWIPASEALRSPAEIESLVEPFLGGDDPLFGTRFTGRLSAFFDERRLAELRPGSEPAIVYGWGAALAGWEDAILVYVDLPKNEIQYRARAGVISNLGAPSPDDPKRMYKRFYFVDWVALNRHKAELLPDIDIVVDEQRRDEPAMMGGEDLREGLSTMSRNYFRVRPWFEPGPWGGGWIRRNIDGLSEDEPNYAWSFELIVPENGLIFESDGYALEVAFDFLMYQAHESVLGQAARRFGYELPIRFNFLDTFNGGNLSVQCHPTPAFIREHFGEPFTQDETYYILACKPGARVYFGFRENIDPVEFRAELERSHREGVEIDVDRFVNSEASRVHELFLIPHQTVHCSGKDNLVLEISSTPYLYTFKMYDWMRVGLDGEPRPLNIERAFANLDFDRKGERVREELVSRQEIVERGSDWRLVHVPTHPLHFYDAYRYEFDTEIQAETGGRSCHVMSVVEGDSVMLESAEGMRQRFNYVETFVVPAAAGPYRLINEGAERAKVIQVFVKPE